MCVTREQEIRFLSLLDGHPNPRSRLPCSIRRDSRCDGGKVHEFEEGELQLLFGYQWSGERTVCGACEVSGEFFEARFGDGTGREEQGKEADRYVVRQNGSKSIIKNVKLNSVIGDA